MKLGTQTGSLTNHILSRATKGQPEPVVGMGATILNWTDRTPGTIVFVGKAGSCTLIQVQEDNYKRTDSNGMSECQTYEYTPNPKGAISHFRFRDGKWEAVVLNERNRWVKVEGGGEGLRIGERDKYHDFSF